MALTEDGMCLFSDLPKEWCDHCRQKAKPVKKADPPEERGSFPARYEGRCAGNCGEPIEVGEYIRLTDDGKAWMHEGCS